MNQHRIVDIRYRRLLRDVIAIPLEEAGIDVDKMEQHEEDKTALLLANIFASGG